MAEKTTLFVLDDNEESLKGFQVYKTDEVAIFTFSNTKDFYNALKKHSGPKAILLDYFFSTVSILEFLENLLSLKLENTKIWLLTGKDDSDVNIEKLRQICPSLQNTWFRKPVQAQDVIDTILGRHTLEDTKAKALIESVIIDNQIAVKGKEPLKSRIVDENGHIVKSYGNLPYTGERNINKEVFEQAFKEGAFSDERFVPLKEKHHIKYYEVTNIPVSFEKKRYLLQLFLAKETPFFRFEREEEYFKETSKKILQALRYAGFSRARLYGARQIKVSSLQKDGNIVERNEGIYYALQIVGHEKKECFFEKGQIQWSAAEHAIINRTQEAFDAKNPNDNELIFEIIDTQNEHDSSEWYDCFDEPKQYLFLPIFDKEGNIIMSVQCDRHGIQEMGASDYTEEIHEEEIVNSSAQLRAAVDMLRKHYQHKKRIAFNKHQGQLLKKILNISPDVADDEDKILENTVSILYETLAALDKDSSNDYKTALEGMWTLTLENETHYKTLAIHGNLPKALQKNSEDRYRIINAFLEIVKKDRTERLDIPNFDENCNWFDYVHQQDLDEIQEEWYKELKSLYFRNIFVNGKLKAVLIFYSKAPYYLSEQIDRLVALAIEKCRLTLEILAKNRERIMLNREMIHDIKSPLNALKHHIALIQDGKKVEPDKLAIYLQKLQSNIDDLSTLGSLDRGILKAYQEEIEFEPFLEEITELFKPLAKEKNLKLSYEIAPNTPKTVLSDKKLLRHILSNLIENAISYTDIGSVTIKALAKGSGKIALRVEDTGKKIKPSNIDLLFELPENSPKDYTNTGLGLYIVKRLCDLLGTEPILVQNESDDRGKYFELTLRAKTSEVIKDEIKETLHALTYDPDELKRALKNLHIEAIAKQSHKSTTKAGYRLLLEAFGSLDEQFKDFRLQIEEYIENFKFKQLDEIIKHYWEIDDE